MGAVDLVLLTLSQNVSFIGKTWLILLLVLRLLVVLLAGFTFFGDERQTFVCNTLHPGCSNVCFDAFSPVSVFHLWLLHCVLLCLPHVLFATYVAHKALTYVDFGAFCCSSGGGGSPFSLETSVSSRELSLRNLPCGCGSPRFPCAYFFTVVLRILLEVSFCAGQLFIFGWTTPKSFVCHEAPCTSGVECYTSRPTEKTLMLGYMLGVSSVSVLLSSVDLLSSIKTMGAWRSKTATLMEEMSKGEQPGDGLSTGGLKGRAGGGSSDALKDERHNAAGSTGEILRSIIKSAEPMRRLRGPPLIGASGQLCGSVESQHKRAWV